MNNTGTGALFDRIAGTYDKLNHILSLGIDRSWRKKAVRGMEAHRNVLDVAIGTGDLAISLVRHGKAIHVTGLDPSAEMMTAGEGKVISKGLKDKVTFVQGSAMEMPFGDGAFDAVTCAYGVRNFPDPDKGLEEMFRVLKPGGELMILEFSYPSNRFIAFFYDLYFSHIMPFVGRVVSRDKTAYKYLNTSVKGFFWGEEMCSRIREAGFKDVSFKPLSFGITTIYRGRK